VGMSVSNAFQGMLTGAQSWRDGIRSLIGSVVDELWRLYVVQQIVGFVSKGLGSIGLPAPDKALLKGRAVGGSVSANTPYMVGEKGPELMIPGGSGTIIPRHNLNNMGGGGAVINVDARGSKDPEEVRRQVQQGIMEAAPHIIRASSESTIRTLRRPRLAGGAS